MDYKQKYAKHVTAIRAELAECDKLLRKYGYADNSWEDARAKVEACLENKRVSMNLPIIPRILDFFGLG